MSKRVVVVGNGPLPRDLTEHVESADFVLRFNEPKASKGMSGTKTDMLMVNNSGKPMQRRLRDPGYFRSPIVQAAREIVFPYHPYTIRTWMIQPTLISRLRGRRSDWTLQALESLGQAGKEVRIMPPSFYEDACAELGLNREQMRSVFPSTGYLGLRHIFGLFPAPDHRVEICGFSWEGWKRHAWADERGWVENKVKDGLLFLID
jgi:hypothetical protein